MLVQGLLPLLAYVGTALGVTILDRFDNSDTNALGSYHGCDPGTGISCTYGTDGLTIQSTDTDNSFYTQFTNGCQDISSTFDTQYLHVTFKGDPQFSIALQQNNANCDSTKSPYPETWDIVNAADYSNGQDIYVPIAHFNIVKKYAIGFAFKAFRNPAASTTFSLVEIVETTPSGFNIPGKKATGPLYFACTRPNSIAFGIDDGDQQFAQDVMRVINEAGIKVTFFTVGNVLDDASLNFTNVYKEALAKGHQVALHSYTHPKIEGLNDVAAIDREISMSHDSTLRNIGVNSKYFRAPYGTDGALTRQRLEALIPGAKVINWSIDIQDWIYGTTDTLADHHQTDAVKSDIAKGGTIVVAHYLYKSTAEQFGAFIQAAKDSGKQIMRIDQCLEDPDAPPL